VSVNVCDDSVHVLLQGVDVGDVSEVYPASIIRLEIRNSMSVITYCTLNITDTRTRQSAQVDLGARGCKQLPKFRIIGRTRAA
jgi:hypothetical protein